jgi:hypothetical protein
MKRITAVTLLAVSAWLGVACGTPAGNTSNVNGNANMLRQKVNVAPTTAPTTAPAASPANATGNDSNKYSPILRGMANEKMTPGRPANTRPANGLLGPPVKKPTP